MAPELKCIEALEAMRLRDVDDGGFREILARVYEFLRMVRLAGGWRSYVAEERRTLATLMALWKRRRSAAAGSSSPLTRSTASTSSRGDNGAPSHESASGDVATLEKIFELPSDVAGRIVRYYTDLVL